MKREHQIYFAVPVAIGLLFWNSQYAMIAILLAVPYFFYVFGVFGILRKSLSRARNAEASSAEPAAQMADNERTIISMVLRSPNQVLGVDQDAGTSTIIHSFIQRVKEEQNDGLRLNKSGRRLAAAKNAMLSKRRSQRRPGKSSAAQEQLNVSLEALLLDLPVFSGKVVQYLNLTTALTETYNVGAELEEIGTCGAEDRCFGRGSSRFLIESQNGRLLSNAGEGQIVFLPGTRFLIVSRKPWQNPVYPETPPGFSFDLVEVA